jgi:hypothetical protein
LCWDESQFEELISKIVIPLASFPDMPSNSVRTGTLNCPDVDTRTNWFYDTLLIINGHIKFIFPK